MKTGNKKQWEYARFLLPYDETMTEERLIKMPRGALFCWIEETKKKRDEARKEENAELAQQYKELIEEQKDDLLSIAQSMTTLKKKGLHEYKGPCPMCGGTDRFIVNTRGTPWWFCRGGKNHTGCNEGGDTVALVAKKNGLTMWEAVEELIGYSPRDRAKVVRQRTYIKTTPEATPPEPAIDLTAKFNRCRQLFSETSLTAFTYFEHERFLTRETVLKNRVGMAQTRRGLAIAYPCERFNDNGVWQITAYNRRYLDMEQVQAMIEKARTEAVTEEEGKHAEKKIRRDNPKTKLIKAGKWGIYRLRRIRGALCLIVVEGEENALSVWQTIRANKWLADVVSVGSQSNFKSLKNDIMAMLGDYKHLIIWADEKNIADQALDLYHHESACAIYSPQLASSEKALDANDLLKRGELDKILHRYLSFLSVSICETYDFLGTSENTQQIKKPYHEVWCDIFDGARPNPPFDDAIDPNFNFDDGMLEAVIIADELKNQSSLDLYLRLEDALIQDVVAAKKKLEELRALKATADEWRKLEEERERVERESTNAIFL